MHNVGDVVRYNEKVYLVVKEMACWQRYQLQCLGEAGEVPCIWKDGRCFEKVMRPLVGVGWDDRMLLHAVPEEGAGVLDLPERPERCSVLWEAVAEAVGTEEGYEVVGDFDEASKEDVCTVHDPAYYDKVLACDQSAIMDTANEVQTPISPTTPTAALVAVSCCLTVLHMLLSNKVSRGFCIVRPPGHHALPSAGMGFCIFNNIAIAAAVALKQYPDVRKVLVFDWDVHHGNGIQEAFYESCEVLYVSVHVSCGGRFYPGTGRVNETGKGKGEGFNLNIPWREEGVTDEEMQLAFGGVVLPVVREYAPDVVLVSAGFDAGEGDPLGMCHVTPGCFRWMTLQLLALGKPVLVALEGGYSTSTVTACALSVLEALRTYEHLVPRPVDAGWLEESGGKVTRSCALSLLVDVARMHLKYWSSLETTLPILERHEARARAEENVTLMLERRRMFESR